MPDHSFLVKMRPDAAKSKRFAVADSELIEVEPLFKSIDGGAQRGVAADSRWHLVNVRSKPEAQTGWDASHALLRDAFGMAGGGIDFIEPDLEQTWEPPLRSALGARDLDDACRPAPPLQQPHDPKDPYWFLSKACSQLAAAREAVGIPEKGRLVRIAHLDTGISNHKANPEHLRLDLAENFVKDGHDDVIDRADLPVVHMPGHGTGTLGILAGKLPQGGAPWGGAAHLEIVPLRVANSVVLFKNSAIARALDHVHSCYANPQTRIHVVTMSMGGLASRAWAEAVNKLYDLGVFIVTAAGNNYFNAPTRHIVYPARFNRVVAACGVRFDDTPYADLGWGTMAGNYGPKQKMRTAMAAYTPNVPWPDIECPETIDLDGQGTSAATPQIAAAAALWIQKNLDLWESYPHGWMRVEAVREALFSKARNIDEKYFGRGVIRALDALSVAPTANSLKGRREEEDRGTLSFWRVLTGRGVTGVGPAQEAMLELEALQLTQSRPEIAALWVRLEEDGEISAGDRLILLEALRSDPFASEALRQYLAPIGGGGPSEPPAGGAPEVSALEEARIAAAMVPTYPKAKRQKLRIFALDPSLGQRLDMLHINVAALDIRLEPDLLPGPVGEYLEVVDIDPASNAAYAPVDLNHPDVVRQQGLNPSEGNPQFHQQMVYAVAMKTIECFERALGRVTLWAPRVVRTSTTYDTYFVRRLRVYPHALREANAYYSPEQVALLFGYFKVTDPLGGELVPESTIFACLSHDIIAHETTHALLDGIHPRLRESTNVDMPAFHEAFSDIVALFQHFAMPEVLRHQVASTRGALEQQNMLAKLAVQFGMAAESNRSGLRDFIGRVDEHGVWLPHVPTIQDYEQHVGAHARGAVLVAAVFEAFLQIYKWHALRIIADATQGTGVLPEGALWPGLVDQLTEKASTVAGRVLNICIRALDYCPPVDLTFGEYLRALITADMDMVAEDKHDYRVAFISAFTRRGIFPKNVSNKSPESIAWCAPFAQPLQWDSLMKHLTSLWDREPDRYAYYNRSRIHAAYLHCWFMREDVQKDEILHEFGLRRVGEPHEIEGAAGTFSPIEVHSVRPNFRVGPEGEVVAQVVVEITQKWVESKSGLKFRGGCTVVIDRATGKIRYLIRKRVGEPRRTAAQRAYGLRAPEHALQAMQGENPMQGNEPFAMLHRHAGAMSEWTGGCDHGA